MLGGVCHGLFSLPCLFFVTARLSEREKQTSSLALLPAEPLVIGELAGENTE